MQSFWHQAPLMRNAISLIIGVSAGIYLPHSNLVLFLVAGSLVVVITCYYLFHKKWIKFNYRYTVGTLVILSFVLAGILLAFGKETLLLRQTELPPQADRYSAVLEDYPHPGKNSIRLDLELAGYQINDSVIRSKSTRVYAYASSDLLLDTLQPGDFIAFETRIYRNESVLNPGQFDYQEYLKNKGIASTVFIHEPVYVSRPKTKPFKLIQFFRRLQNYGVNVFSHYKIPDRELGIASALILGKRDLVDPNLKDDYAASGAVHILAVSGLHVGIIYLVIIGLLNRIFKAKKWRPLVFLVTVVFLWTYAGITGFSPSVLRATVMFSFLALGRIGDHRSNLFNMLAASAIVLVVINPLIIREVGFQLSYFAVLGIAVFYKPIYQLRVFKYWLSDKIWSLLVVAFAAQLATFPLSIYYFGQFPNFFLVSNLVVIPAAMLSLYSGLLLIAVHWIPVLGEILAWILNWTLWCLNSFVTWLSGIPYSISDHLHFGILAVVLLYGTIIFGTNLLKNPSRRNLIIVGGGVLFLTVLWSYRKLTIANKHQVVVLKGDSGDAICLQSGSGAVILLTDTSATARKKNLYHFSGYFDQAGIDRTRWIPYDIAFQEQHMASSGGYVYFNDRSMAVANTNSDAALANELDCGFVLLEDISNFDIENIHSENIPLVLISSTMPYYQRKELIGELDTSGIAYWDMNSRGAYFFNPDQ